MIHPRTLSLPHNYPQHVTITMNDGALWGREDQLPDIIILLPISPIKRFFSVSQYGCSSRACIHPGVWSLCLIHVTECGIQNVHQVHELPHLIVYISLCVCPCHRPVSILVHDTSTPALDTRTIENRPLASSRIRSSYATLGLLHDHT